MKYLVRHSLLAVAVGLTAAGQANAAGASKTVNGIEINYGVVPAKTVSESSGKHDPKMHGGALVRSGSHHLVVSLSDAKTGQRINDASVIAIVKPLGLTPTEKKLDPMHINDTTTWGNYFNFPASSAPFKIVLRISTPSVGATKAVNAEFDYRPPGAR